MLNIEFQPIVSDRNYAPTRTFVTKWDVEIENNQAKKKSRRRERDTKYFEQFDQHGDSLPPIVNQCEYDDTYNGGWELESSDDGEETRQGWLRSVAAENAYYERKYGELKGNFDWYDMNQDGFDTDQGAHRKRFMDEFNWEQGVFKRVRT